MPNLGTSRPPWLAPALAILVVAIAGWIVFAGALGYFFSQDDYAGLARAHGLLPRLGGAWRYLSGQLYFDVMRRVADLDPRPYHLTSLLAHLGASIALLLWIRPKVSWPAAVVGATFFVTHAALYTAVYSISGIGEILALLWALIALSLARRGGAASWLALPAFALSLLSKESTLLLPLVALAERAAAPRAGAPRAKVAVLAGLGVVALAYLALLLTLDVFGTRQPLSERAPYSLAFDGALLDNALTYLGWTASFAAPAVRSFSDAVDPGVHPAGIALAIALLVGCFMPALRRRGWAVGGTAFACFLIPVLPLRNHTYHYYLYAPLAGAALCLAALAAWAFSVFGDRATSPAPARRGARGGAANAREGAAMPSVGGASLTVVAMAVVAAALLVANGASLVRKIERYPFVVPTLRADPTVDRAIVSGHTIADLRQERLPAGSRLVFWSPIALELARAAGADTTRETYSPPPLRGALMDGLAVRLLVPQVERVEFVRGYRPLAEGERYAVYRPDGHVRVVDEAGLQVLLSTLPRMGP